MGPPRRKNPLIPPATGATGWALIASKMLMLASYHLSRARAKRTIFHPHTASMSKITPIRMSDIVREELVTCPPLTQARPVPKGVRNSGIRRSFDEPYDESSSFDIAISAGGLTVNQTAERLGMSAPWVTAHAKDLGGQRMSGRLVFSEAVVLERVAERIQFGRPKAQQLAKTHQDGIIAANVFEMLNNGATLGEIVIELKIHPSRVLEFTKLWMQCGKLSENELAVVQGRRSPPVGQNTPPSKDVSQTESTPQAQPEVIEMPAIPSAPIQTRNDIASLLEEVRRITSKEEEDA